MLRTYFILVLLTSTVVFVSAQNRKPASQPVVRNIPIITEPNAVVWVNRVSFGKTDEKGKILLRAIPTGVQNLKVRADGFKESNLSISAAQKTEMKVALVKTTSDAELAFQKAEREKSAEAYKKVLEINPKFADAFVGLARSLADSGDFEGAHEAILRGRKVRPIFPEISAVEGRVYRSEDDEENAIKSFKRAIKEGKGIQPEAHTGLALLYKEKAEMSVGDFETEFEFYFESLKWFAPAVKQLYGSPDAITIYQMYGLVLEKMTRNQEAIDVYEEFLRIFPNIPESTAVRSFIVQLKK